MKRRKMQHEWKWNSVFEKCAADGVAPVRSEWRGTTEDNVPPKSSSGEQRSQVHSAARPPQAFFKHALRANRAFPSFRALITPSLADTPLPPGALSLSNAPLHH